MRRFASSLTWMALRVPGIDEQRRTELTDTMRQLGDHQGRLGRAIELASLGGLILRSRGWRAAHGDPAALLRMGAHLGGRVVLAAAAATALGATAAGATGSSPPPPGLVGAAAVALALVPTLLAVGKGRIPLVIAASVSGVYLAALSAADLPVRSVGTMVTVGLAAVVLGRPIAPRSSLACTLGWAAPVIAVAAVAAALGPQAADTVVHVGWTLLIPAILVAVGWFDPRYATAAGVVWSWRFLAADLSRIPHETVAVVGDLKASDLLFRLVFMATGVLCASAVARTSLRRTALL